MSSTERLPTAMGAFAAALTVTLCPFSIDAQPLLKERVVQRFDSAYSAYFEDGDWNPADNDTGWQKPILTAPSSAGLGDLDFTGTVVSARFKAGDDLYETVSLKGPRGTSATLDLAGTREFQLLLRPKYSSTDGDDNFVSVLLRLTMADGSMWEAPKVVLNDVWQRAALPVGDWGEQFTRVEWGPDGVFDLGAATGWEVLFVDLPQGTHAVEIYGLYAKGEFVDYPNAAVEPFTSYFASYGGSLDTPEANVLFNRGDWFVADGDTDWIYHRVKHAMHYDRTTYLEAWYRSEGDQFETVSIRKTAVVRFDLDDAKNVVVYIVAPQNVDPNALVLSLKMEDESIWQKGSTLDIVTNLGYAIGGTTTLGKPYRFALDGFERVPWGPVGEFSLDRVKSWELFFNNLGTGINRVIIEKVSTRTLAPIGVDDDKFEQKGQTVSWQSWEFAYDGLHATIESAGDPHDGVRISGESSVDGGFLIEIVSPVALQYVAFLLIGSDGITRMMSFSLPRAGRAIARVHTQCPPLPPGVMARPGNIMDQRCRGLQGDFYGTTLEEHRWELHVSGIPAGEHELTIGIFPKVE